MTRSNRDASPLSVAMQYLTARDRTVREMQTHLDSKDFGEADIDAAIARLIELELLDDRRYAKRYVETRLATKPLSRAHLAQQMQAHGVPQDCIDEALHAVSSDDELQNALAVAQKYARQFAALKPQKRRDRVLLRLQARGYSYDVIRKAADLALSDAPTIMEDV